MKKAFLTVYNQLKALSVDENILCSEFWLKVIRLKENFNEKEAWNLLKENIQWLMINKVINTNQLKDWFDSSELANNGIYIEGHIVCKDEFIIGLGSAAINASGHSRIILFDKAVADCYDTTFVSGYNLSSFTLNDCIGEAFDNAKVTAQGYAKAELWGESNCIAENYSYIIKHEKAKVYKTENVYVLAQ